MQEREELYQKEQEAIQQIENKHVLPQYTQWRSIAKWLLMQSAQIR